MRVRVRVSAGDDSINGIAGKCIFFLGFLITLLALLAAACSECGF